MQRIILFTLLLAAVLVQPAWGASPIEQVNLDALPKGQAAMRQPDATCEPADVMPSLTMEPSYNLRESVLRALQFNPQINSARAQIRGSDFGRDAALSAMGPQASVGYSYEYVNQAPTARSAVPVVSSDGTSSFETIRGTNDVWVLNFNVSQPIFRGFELLSRYQRAALVRERADTQLFNVELQLILAVQTNFLELLRARADVKNALDSVARLESQLKVTSAFYDVGLRPRLDVLQAEVDLATARQELLNAQNRVATQLARLNTLLDLPLHAPVEYVGELAYVPFELPLDECLERAYRQRPDLDLGRKSVEIAQKDAKITASDFYPDVTASWNYSQTGDDPTASGSRIQNSGYSDWSVGVGLDWTFFESGRTYFSYREAKENVAQLEADLANTRLDASFEVKSNYLALREAADRIDVARKSMDAAREGFRMAEARYQAQVGTNTDVLDAQERVSRAEAELTQAQADYLTAMAQLYASMGEQNPSLLPQSRSVASASAAATPAEPNPVMAPSSQMGSPAAAPAPAATPASPRYAVPSATNGTQGGEQ